jgi:hypothetical protein
LFGSVDCFVERIDQTEQTTSMLVILVYDTPHSTS